MMCEESNDVSKPACATSGWGYFVPQTSNAYTVPSSKQVRGFPEGF